ncbi:hypothetical protein QBC42DRAFT_254821 [Cladorrhinum samala]|uniref:Rhodopsin domain-containing protein n=1 Tax=Cladorrhinum samala TaxID=585594 RepID=A0AAV9HH44_9PEZI|nr:hypothetical protein QBC42DRAFT_254821 [Cladorrhinum samala]
MSGFKEYISTAITGSRLLPRNNTRDFNVPPAFKIKNTVDYGPQINFTIWLLTALSAAFLALRIYCKFLRHRGLWWDDHVLIGSWLSLVASCAFVSASITLGFGRSLSLFNYRNLEPYLLYTNLAGTFSILAALWSKTSFGLTILRISSGWTKFAVWFIIISVNIALGGAIVLTWGQCMPIEKTWRPSIPGRCWPKYYQVRYNIITAVYSGATDIILALVPWKLIWPLTINRKEKCGVLVAMSMGVFAGITSIIKITQLPSISNSSFTESTTQLMILAAAEGAITIIAASIPILRALLRDTRPPPGPAQFYGMDFSLYTGSENSRGTGTSNTVISSSGRHSRGHSRNHTRTGSSWSNKEMGIGGSGREGSILRLSKLSRFSGLSMGFSATGSNSGYASGRRPGSRASRAQSRGGNGMHSRNGSEQRGARDARGADINEDGEVEDDWSLSMDSPPPGKIVTTEEVVVEYEVNPGPSVNNMGFGPPGMAMMPMGMGMPMGGGSSIRPNGHDRSDSQWSAVGRAV